MDWNIGQIMLSIVNDQKIFPSRHSDRVHKKSETSQIVLFYVFAKVVKTSDLKKTFFSKKNCLITTHSNSIFLRHIINGKQYSRHEYCFQSQSQSQSQQVPRPN